MTKEQLGHIILKATSSGPPIPVYPDEVKALAMECLALRAALDKPIDMVLHCPECGLQHIDAASDTCVHDACPHDTPCSRGACRDPWTNRPHKTHLCASCGHKWRPCDTHHTNGVQAVPPGSSDSPVVPPLEADGMLIRLGSNREVIYSQHYRNGTIAITTSLKVKRSR